MADLKHSKLGDAVDKSAPVKSVMMDADDKEEDQELAPEFIKAQRLEASDAKAAIQGYSELIARADPNNELMKSKEQSIYRLAFLYAQAGRPADIHTLMVNIRPFFKVIPKARTAKIVRSIIDHVGKVPNCQPLQVELCQNAIEWSQQEKRTFLKQRIQARLASLYLSMAKYKEALALISSLIREVRKFDDKQLLVEISLIEARVHHALQNIPKAKGALTSGRSAATAMYCPPLLQAEIDQMAGILCAEEKDYKTAYSYFYEGFEGFNTVNEPAEAARCLKYMLLTKIMLNTPEEVYTIINSKAGLKYAGVDVDAMRAVADAHKKRDIHAFDRVYAQYNAQLGQDPIILSHLNDLKDNLLEQNLIRLIEPFSRVQINHVAKLIALPTQLIESKLSEMILDKKLKGILDQGTGDLIVFDESELDKTYQAAVGTVKELGSAVDRLYTKAKKLHTAGL